MVMVQSADERRAPLPKPKFMLLDLPKAPFEKRRALLRTERSYYDSEWYEISRFIRPRRSKFINGRPGHGTTGRADDNRLAVDIINTTATIASRTLKSGMHSGLSSPARPWFRLTLEDKDLAESGDVKEYLTAVARRMSAVFGRGNFYNCLHTGYGDIGDFGTSVMMIDENYKDVIRCHTYSPGTYMLATDDEGRVNTVYREFTRTVLACVQKWGMRVSPTVMNMYHNGNLDAYVDLTEVIEPNMQQVRDVLGPRGAPFLRLHYETKGDGDRLLDCKGCFEFPGCVPRWEVRDDDVYGYGPGLEALADARGLQVMELRKQIMIDKMATPPTQGGSKGTQVKHRAGAHTFTPDSLGARKTIDTLYDINPGALQALGAEIQRGEGRVRESYFYDLFLMFAESDRREITAREVDERSSEKLLALGPMLERQFDENLNPAIERVFNIMNRARGPNGESMFPDPPDEIDGMELKVQFVSPLAQAQRAVAIGGIENLWRFAGGVASAAPSVLDKLDADQALDEYADATGVPPGLVLSDDKVAKVRADKAKAAEGAAMAAAAGQAAEIGKTLSQTEVSDENALGLITGGVGAY
jgi:hypothetical protein